jgi:hypothetical protein
VGGGGNPSVSELNVEAPKPRIAQNNDPCHVADPKNGLGAAVGQAVAAQSLPTVATRGKLGMPTVPTPGRTGNWTSPASAALRGGARWGPLKPITGTTSVGGSLARALGPLGIFVVILDAITDAVVDSRAPQGQQPDHGTCLVA